MVDDMPFSPHLLPYMIGRAKQQQWMLCWLLFDQADRPTPLVLYILYGWCEQTPLHMSLSKCMKQNDDLNQFRRLVHKFMDPMHEKRQLDTGTNKWANIQVNIGPYSSKSLQMPLEKALFAMLVCPSVDNFTSEFSRLTDDQPSTAAKGLNF